MTCSASDVEQKMQSMQVTAAAEEAVVSGPETVPKVCTHFRVTAMDTFVLIAWSNCGLVGADPHIASRCTLWVVAVRTNTFSLCADTEGADVQVSIQGAAGAQEGEGKHAIC